MRKFLGCAGLFVLAVVCYLGLLIVFPSEYVDPCSLHWSEDNLTNEERAMACSEEGWEDSTSSRRDVLFDIPTGQENVLLMENDGCYSGVYSEDRTLEENCPWLE